MSQRHHNELENNRNIRHCHIIVGGGTAAVLLALELLKKDNVIIIERGPKLSDDEGSRVVKESSRYFEAADSVYAMKHYTSKQPQLANRRLLYQQGYGIGGTSNINASILTGGHHLVYDKYWPMEWNSKRIDGIFHDLLSTLSPQMNPTNRLKEMIPLEVRYEECKSLIDYSIMRSLYYRFSRNDQRLSLQDLLLNSPEYHSGKLSIITDTEVSVVLIDGNHRAYGVLTNSISSESSTILAQGEGEIILCAGVFESPRILRDSINHAKSIDIHNNLKSIENGLENALNSLQDHCLCALPCLGDWKPFLEDPRILKATRSKCKDNGVHGWVYLNEAGELIDDLPASSSIPSVQLVFVDGVFLPGFLPHLLLPVIDSSTFLGKLYELIRPFLFRILVVLSRLQIVHWICSYSFAVLVCVVQPYSRGSLRFSNDKSKSPIIDVKYLTDKRDEQMLLNGMKTAIVLLSRLAKIGVEYIPLHPSWESGLRIWMRWMTHPYYHACGTCSMRTSSSSGVVNSEFQVYGIERLRIADASVIPAIPTGPISAVCMALGIECGRIMTSRKP